MSRHRKRRSVAVELVRTVAQVVLWTGVLLTFRALVSGADHLVGAGDRVTSGDLFAPFSPAFSVVALFAGPLLALLGALPLIRSSTKGVTP